MGVIFIALLHALPVYLIARLTRNRWVLLIAAAVCAVVAAMFGGERYVVYDLLAIVIAMILAWPLTGLFQRIRLQVWHLSRGRSSVNY